MLVPPLSFQLLLENAIKHNEVSSERPLTVSFRYVNECIEITNPLQEKFSFVESNGLGLSNLSFRVSNLTKSKLKYGLTKDNTHFQVILPLTDKNKARFHTEI